MAHLVSGGQNVDERGIVRFVNDFNFKNVKRFYQVENHKRGFIRAWHGHKTEEKYVYVAKGAALVGAVNLETEEVQKFFLSSENPRVLWIPANNANGFMTLEENTIVIFFSSLSIEEAKQDDIRYPYDKWNIWKVEYR
ncbi:MAG: dTDP-4-dehydrorhamnose 3,5-epimerase family protein [Candidatus Falkowbacteria bacterium]